VGGVHKRIRIKTAELQGEIFTSKNLRSIRPANGLHTRHLQQIMGKRCARDVESGTPLAWDMVQQP
jgi:sialic acid synthase SpsE